MKIKNFNELAKTEERKIVLEIINAGLEALEPEKVIAENFQVQEKILKIKDKNFNIDDFENIYFIGFGKGSAKIAEILEKRLKLKEGYVIDLIPSSIKIINYFL